MSKKKHIEVTELSSIIDDAIGRYNSLVAPSDIAGAIKLELKKLGYTHALHEGRAIPVTDTYLSKKVRKRKDALKTKAARRGVSNLAPAGDISTEDLVMIDLDKVKAKSEASSVSKKYDALMDEYNKLKKALDIKGDMVRPLQSFSIPQPSKQSDTSVAVVLASDWHYEEEIRPESVNYLNDYNLKIADSRIKTFFSNTAKMLQKEQQDTKINTMILALLGDFITGNIHEDNIESSQLGVGEALWAVKSRIHAGIQYLLDNTNVNLVIPCHSGNHGRHTKKQRIANEKDNSLEWLIYKSLAEIWSSNKRVQFMVGDAYHSFVDVFPGYTIRFHHGHNVRYGGGVGGITIPINKAIAQWNRNRPVQLDCMGHFHQYADGGNFVVNSSLIGFSPYAISIKGAYERPSQSFFLINGKYKEKTCSSKIFLEDK
jgi:hypothetical protein